MRGPAPSRASLRQALDALMVRYRWYESRSTKKVPERVWTAAREIAWVLGYRLVRDANRGNRTFAVPE